MRIRSLLLAGAVVPFAVSAALASNTPRAVQGGWVLAQADQACPEGTECPPAEAAPNNRRERRQERRRQQQQQEQGGQAQPAEEQPAEAAPDQPAAEQPQEGQPEAAPNNRRERRQERRRQQQQQEQGGQAQPAEEQPAEAAPEQPAAEQPGEEQPAEAAPDQPAAEQPQESGQEAAPTSRRERARERARRRQQELQQQGGQAEPAEEQPAEAVPEGERPRESAGQEPGAADGESTVEQQLEAQGDQREADQVRALRQKLRRARRDAEAGGAEADRPRDSDTEEAGRARDRERDGRGRVVERRGDRIIIDLGDGRIIVRPAAPDESERLLYRARDVEVENLRDGRTRTTVFRDNGSKIVTVRNRYGEIVRRISISPNGREYVLIDNRRRGDVPLVFERLPPPVILIPQERYIVDLGRASPPQIQEALLAPPVQPVERAYSLEEVTQNESLRAYVPRIDLDTITFEFGSSTIDESEMDALFDLGSAMETVVAEHPDEVYLIEGHTDAVGSDYDNLVLSDQRAEAVAVALSQNFEIPPENLVTEGYGEQYLKVDTEAEERANRRVSVRRITELLQAENQQ